ncbi:MAG: hypothetical protein LBI34_00385 [Puniceicoccales bacterium]|jgi:hypothetical protein|nr:hypothetical protein [Puniceicoccales bacterium]
MSVRNVNAGATGSSPTPTGAIVAANRPKGNLLYDVNTGRVRSEDLSLPEKVKLLAMRLYVATRQVVASVAQVILPRSMSRKIKANVALLANSFGYGRKSNNPGNDQSTSGARTITTGERPPATPSGGISPGGAASQVHSDPAAPAADDDAPAEESPVSEEDAASVTEVATLRDELEDLVNQATILVDNHPNRAGANQMQAFIGACEIVLSNKSADSEALRKNNAHLRDLIAGFESPVAVAFENLHDAIDLATRTIAGITDDQAMALQALIARGQQMQENGGDAADVAQINGLVTQIRVAVQAFNNSSARARDALQETVAAAEAFLEINGALPGIGNLTTLVDQAKAMIDSPDAEVDALKLIGVNLAKLLEDFNERRRSALAALLELANEAGDILGRADALEFDNHATVALRDRHDDALEVLNDASPNGLSIAKIEEMSKTLSKAVASVRQFVESIVALQMKIVTAEAQRKTYTEICEQIKALGGDDHFRANTYAPLDSANFMLEELKQRGFRNPSDFTLYAEALDVSAPDWTRENRDLLEELVRIKNDIFQNFDSILAGAEQFCTLLEMLISSRQNNFGEENVASLRRLVIASKKLVASNGNGCGTDWYLALQQGTRKLAEEVATIMRGGFSPYDLYDGVGLNSRDLSDKVLKGRAVWVDVSSAQFVLEEVQRHQEKNNEISDIFSLSSGDAEIPSNFGDRLRLFCEHVNKAKELRSDCERMESELQAAIEVANADPATQEKKSCEIMIQRCNDIAVEIAKEKARVQESLHELRGLLENGSGGLTIQIVSPACATDALSLVEQADTNQDFGSPKVLSDTDINDYGSISGFVMQNQELLSKIQAYNDKVRAFRDAFRDVFGMVESRIRLVAAEVCKKLKDCGFEAPEDVKVIILENRAHPEVAKVFELHKCSTFFDNDPTFSSNDMSLAASSIVSTIRDRCGRKSA